MAKSLIKKIARIGGIDLNKYDKAQDTYQQLFFKYEKLTMIPKDLFVANLDLCNQFFKLNGDIVECGVWRGGMSAAIAELAGKNKKIHLFDSFEGLPDAQEIDGKEALAWQNDKSSTSYYDNCTADETFAHEAMHKADHTNYEIHKGWFENTLKEFSNPQISILRLDGDWYDSIKVCLDHLFPFVVEGGVIVIDDYFTWDGCAKAVHDYLSVNKSSSRIFQWNNQIAYIVKKEN